MKLFGILAFALLIMVSNSASALSLKLENETGKELHELYFAPAGDEEWGPDQLGDEVVTNGESFTLSSIPEGRYDILFVDEKGAKCDIRDVDFKASETFVMTKKIIKGCQKASEQEEEEEEQE